MLAVKLLLAALAIGQCGDIGVLVANRPFVEFRPPGALRGELRRIVDRFEHIGVEPVGVPRFKCREAVAGLRQFLLGTLGSGRELVDAVVATISFVGGLRRGRIGRYGSGLTIGRLALGRGRGFVGSGCRGLIAKGRGDGFLGRGVGLVVGLGRGGGGIGIGLSCRVQLIQGSRNIGGVG